MTRIRTIKPEFWDSPSTAQAGPWARLLYIALWNWADDFGRGTANLKELEGFAFPNDSTFTDRSGNTVQFRDVVAEVAECFGVVFYTVDERPYFEIPGWDRHQRNERRAKASKYPSPQVRAGVAEIPCNRTDAPYISGPGTGEQGNRGTGETPASATAERDPVAADFEAWWKHYPHKKDKGHALKAYRAARKTTSAGTLLSAILEHGPLIAAREARYRPYAATWLKGERWDDEVERTPAAAPLDKRGQPIPTFAQRGHPDYDQKLETLWRTG